MNDLPEDMKKEIAKWAKKEREALERGERDEDIAFMASVAGVLFNLNNELNNEEKEKFKGKNKEASREYLAGIIITKAKEKVENDRIEQANRVRKILEKGAGTGG